MKKWMTATIAIMLILSLMVPATAASVDVQFRINGELYVTPDGEPEPYINHDNRTMVPVRFFADGLGVPAANIRWNKVTQTATLEKEGRTVEITIGERELLVDSETVQMDTVAEMKQGRTFIPVRFIAEGLGAIVGYESATRTITITSSGSDADSDDKTDDEMSVDEPIDAPIDEMEEQQFDPYGRAIRTTNLPANHADFPYILEELPNEMYEMRYFDPVPERFRGPKVYLEEIEPYHQYIDLWMERVVNYYDLILNVDYETIDSSWVDGIWENMSKGVNEAAYKQTLREYVDWVIENEIQIRGSVKPEPSMIYNSGVARHVRSTIEFEVLHFKDNERVILDVFYNNFKDNIELGTRYTGYFDVQIGTNVGGYGWPHIAVSLHSSIVGNSQVKGLPTMYGRE